MLSPVKTHVRASLPARSGLICASPSAGTDGLSAMAEARHPPHAVAPTPRMKDRLLTRGDLVLVFIRISMVHFVNDQFNAHLVRQEFTGCEPCRFLVCH